MTRTYISPADAMSMSDELAGMKQQPKSPPTFGVIQGNHQRVVMNSGGQAAEQPVNVREITRPGYAVVNQYDPNKVTVGGIETTRQVAETMGWAIDGDQRPFAGSPEPQQDRGQDQEVAQQNAETSPVEIDGDKALDELASGFTGDVLAVATEAAESGDYDAIAEAYGLNKAQVALVAKGAEARANRTLAGTGVDVGLMSQVLDANDLKDARRAAVRGEDDRLRAIADKAVNRLTSWPGRDPQGFKAWFEANVEGKYEIAASGQFIVETSQGWMPFASVVRMNGLKRN